MRSSAANAPATLAEPPQATAAHPAACSAVRCTSTPTCPPWHWPRKASSLGRLTGTGFAASGAYGSSDRTSLPGRPTSSTSARYGGPTECWWIPAALSSFTKGTPLDRYSPEASLRGTSGPTRVNLTRMGFTSSDMAHRGIGRSARIPFRPMTDLRAATSRDPRTQPPGVSCVLREERVQP